MQVRAARSGDNRDAEQMLGDMIADEKDETATEAKGIAAFKPTLRAKLAEIEAKNKLIEVRRSRSSLTQKWIMRIIAGSVIFVAQAAPGSPRHARSAGQAPASMPHAEVLRLAPCPRRDGRES